MERVIKGIIFILLQGIFLFSSSIAKAETIYVGHTLREIRVFDDTVDAPYIEVEDKHGYCYDFKKAVPEYDQFIRTVDDDDRILSVLYHGYSEDSESLQSKYNLSDDEAIALTQAAVWYFREGWGQDKIVHPYMQELIDKGNKKEIPSKTLNIEKEKLRYIPKEDYYETELIGTEGFEGNFAVKLPEGVVAIDSNDVERYYYRVGESFKLRNYGENKTSPIKITGDMNVLELDLYNTLDDTVQDVITTQYVPTAFNLDYEVNQGESRARISGTGDSMVKTGDIKSLVGINALILGLGIAVNIGIKEISRNKR